MKLSELFDNQIVKYRIGRAGPNNVIWEEWTIGPIYVQRRAIQYKNYPAGEIVTLTTINDVTAEYSEDDFFEGIFNCEDYYLEIFGLTGR